MLSFDEVQEELGKIVDRLPPAIFDGLNGGVILLPYEKQHAESRNNDLFVMGEYHYEPLGLGRYVNIYYGSFVRSLQYASDEYVIKQLEDVLHHELVHHLEHLAGDRSLEVKDAVDIAEYKRRYGNTGEADS